MGYDLEYRKGGQGFKIVEDTKEGQAVCTALNALSSIKARRYFKALGQTFQIISQRKHASKVYVSFMKVSRKEEVCNG